MKLLGAFAAMAALMAVASTAAAEQVLDLTGQFRCVQGCADGLGGQPAFVTQNGWDLHLVNEAGQPSRAWIDWPGHIWVKHWNEGAVYSPDGLTIQFDRGTVWRRVLSGPALAVAVPPPNAYPTRNRREAAVPVESTPVRAPVRAYDGSWSVVVMTRSGGCDPAYRYGVRIVNGNLVNDIGQSVNLRGHVWRNGAIRVSVASGGQYANGAGRLSRTAGYGTWRGQGSTGSCAGVWQAARRS